MTFCPRSLVRVAQVPRGKADGTADTVMLSKWFYGSEEAFAVIAAAGFFNGARNLLKVGDIIEVSAAANKGGLYSVATVPASGNVTVTAAVLA